MSTQSIKFILFTLFALVSFSSRFYIVGSTSHRHNFLSLWILFPLVRHHLAERRMCSPEPTVLLTATRAVETRLSSLSSRTIQFSSFEQELLALICFVCEQQCKGLVHFARTMQRTKCTICVGLSVREAYIFRGEYIICCIQNL
jgi:hypothetical protein